MNRYPLWKYLIMIVAVVIGFFYTVPNIFPQVPAVQVSTNKTAVRLDAALLERVEKTLKTAGVAIASSELDPANGVHVRFAKGDSDSQVKAKELLLKDLNNGVADGTGNYIIALTSESTTPHWMQNLNAKPMALGLDLRGGSHLMLEATPQDVEKAKLEALEDTVRAELRSRMLLAAESAGMAPADYALRVRNKDEAANAILDDAMTELTTRVARDQALLQAFEASGKTVNDFAGMYGLHPIEAAATLNRARARVDAAQATQAAADAAAQPSTADATAAEAQPPHDAAAAAPAETAAAN